MRRIILAISIVIAAALLGAPNADARPAQHKRQVHRPPRPHLVKHAHQVNAHVVIPPSALVKRKPRARKRGR